MRQACIDAGLRFISKGQPDFSFRELARHLKVSPGAPYKHFENKEALLAAICEEGFVRFAEALRGSKQDGEGRTAKEAFDAMGEAYVRFAVSNADHYRMMFSNTVPDHAVYPSLQEKALQSFSELTSLVASMQAQGYFRKQNVVEQSMLIWTQVHGMVSLIIEGRMDFVEQQLGYSVEELHKKIGEQLLESLR